MDGALGSRGAWLLEPYADLPDEHRPERRGRSTRCAQTAQLRHRERLPAVHPRDRRPRQPRDAQPLRGDVQGAPRQEGRALARRARAAHRRAPTSRASAQLGVIASMQGIHCTSDAPYVLARLGPQRAEEGAYVWQKLMKIGRGHRQRHRRAGRGRRSAARLLRARHAQAEERPGLLRRPADDARRGAEGVHAERRLRGVRGGAQGAAEAGQAGGHHGAVGRHHADSRRRRSRRPRSPTRSSGGRSSTGK